jgi:hypothetical protein
MKTITVEFSARFTAKVQVDDDASPSDVADAIADIDIPENAQCTYIADSFEPDDLGE